MVTLEESKQMLENLIQMNSKLTADSYDLTIREDRNDVLLSRKSRSCFSKSEVDVLVALIEAVNGVYVLVAEEGVYTPYPALAVAFM